jgi:CcmD family protein
MHCTSRWMSNLMTQVIAFLGVLLVIMTAVVTGQAPQPGGTGTLQQEGFTPIDQLPPQDQLPAAPLLIAAYAFVMIVLFVYIFSVARRLTSVKQQVARLEGDIQRNRKS